MKCLERNVMECDGILSVLNVLKHCYLCLFNKLLSNIHCSVSLNIIHAKVYEHYTHNQNLL